MTRRGPKPKPPEEKASERLSIALTPLQKQLIESAAELSGVTTSQFIAVAANNRAKSVVKKKSQPKA
ncbi:MAG: DUF1778 domain-containing protein [Planctomycetota bacterium]